MAMLSPRANESRAPTLESRRRSDTLEDAIGIYGDWHASGRAASGDRTCNGGLATGVSPFRHQSAPVPVLPGDNSRKASGAAPAPGSTSQGAGGAASGGGRAQLPGVGSVGEEADHPGSMQAPQQQDGVERSAEEPTVPKLSLAEETLQTVSLTWPVMTSFFLSVTLMYLVRWWYQWRSTGLCVEVWDTSKDMLQFATWLAAMTREVLPMPINPNALVPPML